MTHDIFHRSFKREQTSALFDFTGISRPMHVRRQTRLDGGAGGGSEKLTKSGKPPTYIGCATHRCRGQTELASS